MENRDYTDLLTFNATVCHELKVPLRAIDSYLHIFMEDYGTQIDEEILALIQNIRKICKDTLNLISCLLDYSKGSKTLLNCEKIDLRLLLHEVFQELTDTSIKKQLIHLEIQDSVPQILGDRILFKQIFINLLSNSIKFTREKEFPLITFGYKLECGEHIFYLKDNGAGFDMKFSDNLFELFRRMHTTEEFEGNGVGLATVKNIISKFWGRTWITGEVENGACVYFTLDPEFISHPIQ